MHPNIVEIKCIFLRFNEKILCINRNNHQKPTFHPLGDFLNPALALLGQGLKKSPIGQKLDFANHPLITRLTCCIKSALEKF
jgi:hypothetical protein